MSNETTIPELNQYIEEQKKLVGDLEALNRLAKNEDFIRIIDKGFFETEAVRLVMLKADSSQESEQNQANIIKGIDAIGYLRKHFECITQKGRYAENQIEEAKAAIEELAEEETV